MKKPKPGIINKTEVQVELDELIRQIKKKKSALKKLTEMMQADPATIPGTNKPKNIKPKNITNPK